MQRCTAVHRSQAMACNSSQLADDSPTTIGHTIESERHQYVTQHYQTTHTNFQLLASDSDAVASLFRIFTKSDLTLAILMISQILLSSLIEICTIHRPSCSVAFHRLSVLNFARFLIRIATVACMLVTQRANEQVRSAKARD